MFNLTYVHLTAILFLGASLFATYPIYAEEKLSTLPTSVKESEVLIDDTPSKSDTADELIAKRRCPRKRSHS